MKTRRLDRIGPELSAIGLGCMGMSAFYGGRDGEGSVRTLHRAVELGVTLFDSADVYGNGANEELVGRKLKRVRDRVFLATKFAKGCTPGQLALAWVLAQGDDLIPIPGTKKVHYLEENVAAAGIVLTADDLAAIDDALPPGAAAGERYAPEAMRALNG